MSKFRDCLLAGGLGLGARISKFCVSSAAHRDWSTLAAGKAPDISSPTLRSLAENSFIHLVHLHLVFQGLRILMAAYCPRFGPDMHNCTFQD